MRIKAQLTLATLFAAGLFATGCSQQTAGASQQTATASPAQQTTQSSQQATTPSFTETETSMQSIVTTTDVTVEEEPKVVEKVRTIVDCSQCSQPKPVYRPTPRPTANKWAHTHPAIPGCTDSVTHTHPFTDPNHKHKYACRGQAPKPVYRPAPVPTPIYRPAPIPAPVYRPVTPYVPPVKVPSVKAKGNYRGPVLMSPSTREALEQYQQ